MVGPISATATPTGAYIASNTLYLAPADADNAGVMNTVTQTFAGLKTFNSDLTVNGITVGKGAGSNNDMNTAIGKNVLSANTTGFSNTAIGIEALYANTEGAANTAIGQSALSINLTGTQNTAIGYSADVLYDNLENATAIGAGAIATYSNTIQLGNTSVTDVKTHGTITAGAITYPNTAGTNGYVLTTNGTGAATWAARTSITEVSDEFTATAAQTSFTITHAKGINRTIKMYINGIRISNTAYSDSSTTVSYNSANNGGYTIVAGDRIQFDYSY